MTNLTHHQALIHVMVTMSAVDRSMGDAELAKMGDAIKTLPVFSGYNTDSLVEDVAACSLILQDEDGLDQIIQNAIKALPEHLFETAYALAVDVAAADLHVEQTELRLLQVLRQEMNIDRLACAAIERGAKARFQTL
ncbi:MAG: tellurite resistance TerB family protein [Rhizobiaceae bacterium]